MLPPSAEAPVPEGLDDAARGVGGRHPDRQEVRMTVAVLRDGTRESALRLREKDAPTEVLTGAGPGAGSRGGAVGDVRRVATTSGPRGDGPGPPAARGRRSARRALRQGGGVAAADVLQGAERVVDGVDLDEREAGGGVLVGRRAVVGGRQEVLAPLSRAPMVFISMPPIGPTLPSSSIVPVPATNFPPVRLPGVSLSYDPQREHQSGAGPAHVRELDVDVEREGVVGPGRMPTTARSSPRRRNSRW